MPSLLSFPPLFFVVLFSSLAAVLPGSQLSLLPDTPSGVTVSLRPSSKLKQVYLCGTVVASQGAWMDGGEASLQILRLSPKVPQFLSPFGFYAQFLQWLLCILVPFFAPESISETLELKKKFLGEHAPHPPPPPPPSPYTACLDSEWLLLKVRPP